LFFLQRGVGWLLAHLLLLRRVLLLLHHLYLLVVLLVLLLLVSLLGGGERSVDAIGRINIGNRTNPLGVNAVACEDIKVLDISSV